MFGAHLASSLRYFTYLGDAALWVFLALNLYWAGKRRLSTVLVVAILVDVILNKVVKYSLAMPRPDESLWLIGVEDPYGFPSGHSETAFMMATFFSLVDLRASPLFILAGLTGYSRIVLRIHYPIDVVGGAFLGIMMGWMTYKLKDVRFKPTREHRILTIATSFAFGLALFLWFPIRRALTSGFVGGMGLSFSFLSRDGSSEKQHTSNQQFFRAIIGSITTGTLLLAYAMIGTPMLKGLVAFLMPVWAFLIYPSIYGR